MRSPLLLLCAALLLPACAGGKEEAPPTVHTAPATGEAASADEYYCPMHPEIRSEAEGRCPKCNMHLVKPGQEHQHGGGANTSQPGAANTSQPAGG